MEDEKFRSQIIAFQLNKMTRGMNDEEFTIYCLAHKHIWEGIPLRWWAHKVKPKYKWIIKRAIKENLTPRRQLIVNWCPLRIPTFLSVNKFNFAYVRHLFDLQPQRN